MKLRPITFLGAVVAALLASCKGAPDGAPPVQVNLTAPKTAYSIPTIIALEKGLFAKQNLDVTVNYVNTGKLAMDDLLGGKASFANVVETNVAFAGYQNPDISVIATIEAVYDAAIVARKDKGIATAADLKGKKIGVMLATTSQIFAERFLEKNNIAPTSVTTVSLLPAAMQAALIEGSSVDAISLWQPYVHNVEKALEGKTVVFTDRSSFTGYMTLAANGTFIKANPGVAERMLKAYRQSEEFLRTNTTESQTIIGRVLGLDTAFVREIWDQYDFTVRLDKSLLDATTTEGRWVKATQTDFKQRSLPDYSTFFNPGPLRAADSTRVKW